jgi:hypothetical protein
VASKPKNLLRFFYTEFTLMKNTRPVSRVSYLRHICFALCLCFALLAGMPVVPTPANAKKGEAEAKAHKVTAAAAPPAAIQSGPQIVGQWGPVEALDTVPVHISVLPDKRLLYWGRDKHPTDQWDIAGSSQSYTWNFKTKAKMTIPNYTTNLFCSGHSFMPDGRLLVTGGHNRYDPAPDIEGIGEDDVNIFDYNTNNWLRLSTRLPRGRWYPSNVTLGTGETVIVSGGYWDGTSYEALMDGRVVPKTDDNKSPDVITLAGHIRPFTAIQQTPLYPYLHLTTNGNVFLAGPMSPSRFIDPFVYGGLFTNGPATVRNHLVGTAVTFDATSGKVLMVGGYHSGGTPITNAETITPSGTSAVWQTAAPLMYKRKYHSATILPDGKVLVTGGTQCGGTNRIDCAEGAATVPELWDPNVFNASGVQIGKWTQMASNPVQPTTGLPIPRVYHSVALLLPDARVLVGGGGLPAAGGEWANGVLCADGNPARYDLNCRTFGHKDVEIFSPPYLFNTDGTPATQPIIISAPDTVSYGQTFSIAVSNPNSISKASLVRLPSVTHGFSQDQRINFMTPLVSGTSSVNVTAPADANTCPPGHYMLFIMNSAGVPSEAKIIKVQQDDGYLDGADCNQVWGWAWDRNNPNTPINVDIYDGPAKIATVAANLFRQDLLNAGKGNGYHGFVYTLPATMNDRKAHHISVKFANKANNLGSSPRSKICDVSLFPTVDPATITAGAAGGSTWEQATQFSSYVNGRITHIRYYKVSGETGTHVGRIWNDTGTLLAQVTFANETAFGWQEAILPTPLQITAGVKYRVSYNVNTYGAKIPGGLGSPFMNWPLTSFTGFYSTPAGTFPNTGSVSNFVVDIRFTGQ